MIDLFTEPAPSHELPAEGVAARAAYDLVSNEMMLDGDPSKNLATFVTTWMEPEARLVIDTVNLWDPAVWQPAGFRIHRLGVGSSFSS